MCDTDLCNNVDYDIHSERAKRLFNNATANDNSNSFRTNSFRTRANALLENSGKKESVVIVTGESVDVDEEEEEDSVGNPGELAKDEIYYAGAPPRGLERLDRTPRQLNDPGKENCKGYRHLER